MTRWRFQLFLSLLIGTVITVLLIDPVVGAKHPQYIPSHSHQEDTTIYKKTVLTVGYLTAIKGDLKDKQGLAISGALTMALEEVSHFEHICTSFHLMLFCCYCCCCYRT